VKRADVLQQPIRPEPRPAITAERLERRGHTRFPVSISAEVTELKSRASITGRATDLGVGGCYVDALNPFPKGAHVGWTDPTN
jgi:hypothetical protein